METGIVNLDDSTGQGTHWVVYRNIDNNIFEYFDPFELKNPYEVQLYLQKSGDKLVYSTDQIQERDSVLCGYWCLYYLLERQTFWCTCAECGIKKYKFVKNRKTN